MKNDSAYNNVDHIPGGADYPDIWAVAAREYREIEVSLGRARLNDAYGPHERQKLDLFHPAGPAEGLLVFIHGGYWLRFDRSYWSHLAAGANARGWAVAMPSYRLAPEVRIAEIKHDVAAAVAQAATRVAGPIRLAGHSAGGHLVARMLMSDGGLQPALRDRLRAAMVISPVSDLRPLLETSMNDELCLDRVEADAESPALGVPAVDLPVTVWVGADERPVFLDQARWLADAWTGSALIVEPDRHHFDIVEGLANPESTLTRALFGQVPNLSR